MTKWPNKMSLVKVSRFCVAALFCGTFSGTLQAESLRQALVSAYNASGLIQQNRALLRAADEDVAVAASALGAVVTWTATTERSLMYGNTTNIFGNVESFDSSATSANLGINANLTLFDGGRNKFALAAAKEAVFSTRQKLIGVEQRVLLAAIEAFMEVRENRRTVKLRKNNLRVIQEELRAAQDRFEVGEVTKTDVALAQARLAASQSALASAQGNLQQAEEIYKQVVGKRAGDALTTGDRPKMPASASAVKASAVRAHPDIVAVQHDIKQAEFNISRAEAAYQPTVSLSGRLGYTDSDVDNDLFNRSATIGLTAQGTLYSSGRLPALLRKARAQRDAQRSALHLVKLKLEQEAGTAFAILEISRASRKASEEQIRASRVAFEGVREEAKVGSRTTLDVLNAEQELLDAQAGLLSVETDEFVSAYRVLAQMGKLTVEHLNLPVQKYDPQAYYNLVEKAPSAITARGAKLDQLLESLSK